MNDVERELKAMLADRAQRMGRPGNGREVMRRARRGRVATAGTAALACLAIVSVSFAAVGGRDPRTGPAPASSPNEDPYAFESTPGEYPFVASGSFRDATWSLRAAAVRTDPGSDVRLTFSVEEGGLHSTSTPIEAGSDPLTVELVDEPHALPSGTDALFGAAAPGVRSVDVELDDGQGTTIPAHLFTGHDARTESRDGYYVVFVPRDADGWVLGRDRFGTTIVRRPLGEPRSREDYLASGRSGDTSWTLTYSPGGTGRIPHGDRGEHCLLVTDDDRGNSWHCIERDELRLPLYISLFSTEGGRVVAAVVGPEVTAVRLRVGSESEMLPILRAEFNSSSIRLVATGFPQGEQGRLQAIDRRGRVVYSTGF